MIGFEILNLEHRIDRKFMCMGNFMTQGVPFENITFHKAINGADYPDTESICKAAADDGFPEVWEMGGRGDAAYHWGFMRILREIAYEDYPFEFAYFNQDDRIIPQNLSFNEIQSIISILSGQGNFLLLQLGWNHLGQGPIEIHRNKIFSIYNRIFYSGIHSPGDSGLIVSKSGAKLLMQRFKETQKWCEELILELDGIEGCYSLWETIVPQSSVHPKWYGYSEWFEGQDRLIANE